MKAIELTGSIDALGNLSLDQSLVAVAAGPVKVIVLFEDNLPNDAGDPDDTPLEEVKASLQRALSEARSGQRLSLLQALQGLDD
jgi:hypothetical protein